MNTIAYVDTGHGDPVVLLHGGFLDHHMWDAQVAALAAEYRVIAPDARGHGASPNGTEPFRHPDDLAALLRQLNVGPSVLVGVSMGASIAVDTALEHPSLVRALVVSGAATSEPEFTDPWTLSVLRTWTAAMAAGDLDGSVDAFLRFAAGPHRTLRDVDPDVVRRLCAMAGHTMAKHAVGEVDQRIPVTNTWARAAREITVPTLGIVGGLDSPDHVDMTRRLVALVPGARTVTIDGTAHYPNMERPEEFNRIVGEFLRG